MLDTSPRRRTQAQRSTATRERILSAAFAVLHSRGYAGATMVAIKDEAGLSLGAMQHHFPTKAKLMAAVVRHVIEDRRLRYSGALRSAATPPDRMERLWDAGAEMMRRPEAAAVMEIQLARRSDPDLDRETRPIFEAHDRRLRRWVRVLGRQAGVADPARVALFQLLNNAVLRGLILNDIDGVHVEDADRALAVWRAFTIAEMFK